jgi:hypothetical protein
LDLSVPLDFTVIPDLVLRAPLALMASKVLGKVMVMRVLLVNLDFIARAHRCSRLPKFSVEQVDIVQAARVMLLAAPPEPIVLLSDRRRWQRVHRVRVENIALGLITPPVSHALRAIIVPREPFHTRIILAPRVDTRMSKV